MRPACYRVVNERALRSLRSTPGSCPNPRPDDDRSCEHRVGDLRAGGRAVRLYAVRRGLIVVGLTLSIAGCGGGQLAPKSTRAAAGAASASGSGPAAALAGSAEQSLPPGSRVLLTTKKPVSQGYVAAGSLYFTETIPADQHTAEIYDLVRVNSSSGRVAATHRFNDAFDHALVVGGSLWVTTSDESRADQTSLWRLNPSSLAVRSHVNLPSAHNAEGQTGSLATADGQLWVGTGTLDRVSLTSGRVDRVVNLHYPGSIQVAADPTGRILLASLGYKQATYIAGSEATLCFRPRHVAHLSVPLDPGEGADFRWQWQPQSSR